MHALRGRDPCAACTLRPSASACAHTPPAAAAAAANFPRRSALHFAAALGNLDATKLLIEAGSDLNLQDKDGEPRPRPGSGASTPGQLAAVCEMRTRRGACDSMTSPVVGQSAGPGVVGWSDSPQPMDTSVAQREGPEARQAWAQAPHAPAALAGVRCV